MNPFRWWPRRKFAKCEAAGHPFTGRQRGLMFYCPCTKMRNCNGSLWTEVNPYWASP